MQPSGGLCLLFNMRFRVQIFQVNFPSFIFLIPKIMYPILDGIRKKKRSLYTQLNQAICVVDETKVQLI